MTLDVLSDDAMMFFIMSFAGGLGSLNENTSFPDLHFYAEANISNPNLLGGTAEEGPSSLFCSEGGSQSSVVLF